MKNAKISVLKSKIHRAFITENDIDYVGSLTVDPVLLEAANLYPYEAVQVLNINSGTRYTTYLVEGIRGSKQICQNGAAARLGVVGDPIIIMSFCDIPAESANSHKPSIVIVNELNEIIDVTHDMKAETKFSTLVSQ